MTPPIAADLPGIELAHLSGRVGTRKSGPRTELFAHALAFTTMSGERLDPARFTLTVRGATAAVSKGLADVLTKVPQAKVADCL